MTAVDVVMKLRQDDPRVFVDADGVNPGLFAINPMCMTDEEADFVVERIKDTLEGKESGTNAES